MGITRNRAGSWEFETTNNYYRHFEWFLKVKMLIFAFENCIENYRNEIKILQFSILFLLGKSWAFQIKKTRSDDRGIKFSVEM